MKIGLLGFGKMGKRIAEIAISRGHEISVIIDPHSEGATARVFDNTSDADVFIDFSAPDSVLEHIETAIEFRKNIIVGTTGWTEHLPEIQKKVEQSKIGFLWSSNFSPAVQMFFLLAQKAAQVAEHFPECDIAGWEAHHRHKLDAPSGTALTLGEILLSEISRKKNLLLNRPTEKINPEDLHLATIRVGEIPGTHAVLFDFPDETIEIKSTSRSRGGFALGAVMAAEFLQGKSGFYDFRDVFSEKIKDSFEKRK